MLVVLLAIWAMPSVNALPGFSDHTGPSDLHVTEFDRLEAGCEVDVRSFRGTSIRDGTVTRTGFVPTGGPGASLSARTERTSPPGADLSTFRIHVDSRGANTTSESAGDCRYGVVYRLTVDGDGRSPEGILPDAPGFRLLWYENDTYAGCTASLTSPLGAECHRFADDPRRVWANAT